jgi:predicted transcriptional regulator YdeE
MKTTLIIIAIIIAALILLYLALIGKTDKSEPEIIKLDRPICIIGLEINTDDKAIYKDVAKVAARFNKIKTEYPIPNLKKPWASINISKDYDPEKRTFTYVVGDVVTQTDSIPPGLKAYEIPPLTYAIFPIRPKSKIAWGITMGRMKKFIYAEWLPNSIYLPSDSFGEFELHDERSLGRHPEINLHVAIKEKDK